MDKATIIWVLLFLPFLGSAISYFVVPRWSGVSHVLSSLVVLVLAVIACLSDKSSVHQTFHWIDLGAVSFDVGIYFDSLTAIMTLVVAIVALMVAIFSLEYMKDDPSRNRYFGLLGFFAFAMYGIVLSSNLLMTFVFWELVGFASYSLIGFWFQKHEPPRSSFKAFIMNKVGDTGFLIGIFVAFAYLNTLDIKSLNELATAGLTHIPSEILFLLGIGLFLAVVGKSAQFPLMTWLPDAMTGPTPVSALMHAATMVASGVYLMVRVYPLLSEDVLMVMVYVGGVTAFMGAFSAFRQNDIKKVLAHSTVSQLGYMVMAVGAGYPLVAFYHLVTHAFFKAGLFLCAGSVIHYFHETRHEEGFDANNIANMGGLKRVLPYTYWVFTICMLALAGVPLFSGYLSKELILAGVLSGNTPVVVVFLAFITVFMTATYMSRLYFRVFYGDKEHAEYTEQLPVKIALLTLGAFSIGFLFSVNPINANSSWIIAVLHPIAGLEPMVHSFWIPLVSILLVVSGFAVSYFYNVKNSMTGLVGLLRVSVGSISENGFYLDSLHKRIISKLVLFKAHLVSRLDSYLIDGVIDGLVQSQLLLAKGLAWFDKKFIDALIELLAKSEVVLAYVLGWFDKYTIDGFVNFIGWLSGFLGDKIRSVQGGSIQMYFAWALAGLLIIYYFLR